MARTRLMGDPPELLISPDLTGIGAFDFHRGEELIALAEAATEAHLPAIMRLVSAPVARQSGANRKGTGIQAGQ